jgi:hypothetical protein
MPAYGNARRKSSMASEGHDVETAFMPMWPNQAPTLLEIDPLEAISFGASDGC